MAVTTSHAGSKIRGMGCHKERFLIRSSEAYQLAMHTLDQYRGTVVACRYFPLPILARPESLATLKARFCDALARVVLAQPHLQIGIVGENSKNPAFVCLDRVDFRNHVQWITLDDSIHFQQLYLKTMQAQLDSRYENLSTQPGWRVVVLHEIGAESIEVFGKIFHQYLLRRLNEITSQDKEPIVEVAKDWDRWILDLPNPSDKLPPNPEILTSWPVSPGFVLLELWKGLKPALIFPPGNTHARWAPIQAYPYQTRFRNFTVDGHLVTKLVCACCLHHATLTGLVQALCLVSLSTALQGVSGFASRTPYDLRHILPSKTKQYPWLQPKESMCNYVSVVDHEFDPKLVDTIRSHMPAMSSDSKLPVDVVDVARLDSGTRNDLIGIMKLCPDWNSQQQNKMHRMRYLSWLVTNPGVLDGENSTTVGKEETWSLRRAELILSAETPSAALSVSIMTVKGREMCVMCSWQDCVVDAELGERLMRDLERGLKDIGS
ncbi:hypothetical protein K458DRAFT_479054 [Lentithecium fluviatile CBS 122367]|uniref:Alcohol acetyltransferase n=1 Tax=Lentithecium fluviatile CBS 122367 TaxID=1168545 RepID=A0A6G1IWB3_9PLEO|nr:hypothetical protein K458DRAFT_479054 [Lentithecium fluviatile CBS 122367]